MYIFVFRYYYDKSILKKVHGKRYTYKFDFNALMQICQGLDPSLASSYKYVTDFTGNYVHFYTLHPEIKKNRLYSTKKIASLAEKLDDCQISDFFYFQL